MRRGSLVELRSLAEVRKVTNTSVEEGGGGGRERQLKWEGEVAVDVN